jgi:hypothetical protein
MLLPEKRNFQTPGIRTPTNSLPASSLTRCFSLPSLPEGRYGAMVFSGTGKQPFDKQQLFI